MADMVGLIRNASEYVKTHLGINIMKTSFTSYNANQWRVFSNLNGFDYSNEGIYIPQVYKAYVRTDSDTLTSNIFHETYGHGLFCEHSIIGRNLVNFANKKGNVANYLYDDIDQNRNNYGLAKDNITNYEGIAHWFESKLCKELGIPIEWEKKKLRLPKPYRDLFEYFQEYEQQKTQFALLARMGFPKYYDNQQLESYLRCVYGAGINLIKYCVCYGSRKPYSDIDLFIVTDEKTSVFSNAWLDIYSLNTEEYNQLKSLMDVSVTDPLFSGTLVYGDKHLFELERLDLLNMKITDDAVRHNSFRSVEQGELSHRYELGSKEYNSCVRYSTCYKMASNHLAEGNKYFTEKQLLQHKDNE